MSDIKLDAAYNNLSRIRKDRSVLSEKSAAHISELAELLCNESESDEIFFRDELFISRYKAITEPKIPSVSEFNRDGAEAEAVLLSHAEKALLNTCICDILGLKDIRDVSAFFDDPLSDAGETVACVKSRITDTAYLRFASEMSEPRISYVSDLNEACESVAYGKTAYCILPISIPSDGRLPSFRVLSLKYSLKTAKCCKISNKDGTFSLFALLKKEPEIPKNADNAYFQFVLNTDKTPTELLSVAECYKMKPVSVIFTPENGGQSDIVLKISESGMCPFLSYLSLTYPDFVSLGIFKEI